MKNIRNTAIATAAGLALVATTSLAVPNIAEARGGKELGWLLGGLVAGAIIADAAHSHGGYSYGYGAPVYYQPQPHCWWKERQVWDPYYGPVVKRDRVCR